MAQITLMTQSVIKGRLFFLKEIQHPTQYFIVILIYDLTGIHGHDIIKAAALMHTERKRAVLAGISEGKLHLITVRKRTRA